RHRRIDGHHGVDRGRVHGVDPNAVWCKRIRERAHQPDQTVLGRSVAQPAALQAAEATQTCGRAGEHDGATTSAGDEVRYRRLRGVICANEIHVEDVGPHFEVLVVGQLTKGHRCDARVGQYDVQPAELFHAGIERSLQRVEVADVGDRGD